ncbi:MAG TPA: T9SS type A sorting domain-containing protein [Candidatus Fermentibacter daniensis]|nr:T9SS type A sorting domain-containing protein [Candidatus Fermentibacter daniensis]HOG54314.1 T9SS type A sorting domain-containing protein [Candidatus Fermentibacter daniensis]
MKLSVTVLLLCIAGLAVADSAMDRVMTLIEAGELQGADAAYALAASVVDQSLLPAELTEGTEPARCGTPAVMEAIRLAELDDEAPLAAEAMALLARPSLTGPEYTLDSPAGHFKIHWTNSGADATNLAYATALANHADNCWAVECTTMGYDTPPSDLGLGGDTKYDLYIKSIASLGYTTYSGEPSDPTTPENDYASHIVICVGLSDNLLKVTQAHEFQHAIQMGYDVSEPTWFMENCATWMEDMVYDEVNDYVGYLQGGENPLRRPWFDIRSSQGLYWYGGCLWTRYMAIRMGTDAILDIWEKCGAVAGNNTLAAQGEVFQNHGMTWEQGFMEYACWRWFTAANYYSGCGMYDDEAALWTPGPYTFSFHNINSLPASGDNGVYPPETYGIHWIKVKLDNYQTGWVNMHFDGRDNFEWNLGVIMWDTAGDFEFQWYDCNPSTGVKDVGVNPAGWDYVIFFPAFMSITSVSHTYTFDITWSATGIEGDPASEPIGLSVSSNPAGPSSQVVFTLPAASDARLDVFDLSGRIVSTLHDGTASAGQHSVSLGDLTTGTYFVRLCAGGQMASRRIVFTN